MVAQNSTAGIRTLGTHAWHKITYQAMTGGLGKALSGYAAQNGLQYGDILEIRELSARYMVSDAECSVAMICGKCSTRIDESSIACHKCGAATGMRSSGSQPKQEQQAPAMRQISDNAAQEHSAPVITERTSKRFKWQLAASAVIMAWSGLKGIGSLFTDGRTDLYLTVFFIALFWFGTTLVRAWWNHG